MNLDRIFSVVDRLTRWLGLCAGCLLVVLAIFTVAAALSRYLFNAPLQGAQDIASMALVVVVFASVSWCGRTGGHVSVDLFVDMMGPKATRWTELFVRFASAAIFAVLTARCIQEGFETTVETQSVRIPAWPFFFVIAAGAALYTVILFLEGIALLVGRRDLEKLKE